MVVVSFKESDHGLPCSISQNIKLVLEKQNVPGYFDYDDNLEKDGVSEENRFERAA